jgi:hypothetical protein
MKKLISILLAVCICQTAFLIPVYAEDGNRLQEAEIPTEIEENTVITETITQPPEIIILPSAAVAVEQTEPETTTATNGVINTPSNNRPQGAGTLLEDVCQSQVNRQFITVQSRGGNVFYIIIEHDRSGQNVYFLNAVDDFDLLSFSDNFPEGVWEAYEELKEEAVNNAINAEIEGEDGEGSKTAKPTTNSDPEENPANNTQNYIVAGIGVLFLGGLVYFKFIKGKKKTVKTPLYDSDEEEDEDEEYDETGENEEAEED